VINKLAKVAPDQAALIIERLGRAKVDELSVDCPDSGTLYRRCVRAMGGSNGGKFASKVPTKGQAYVEVLEHRGEEEMPEFSHRYIEKAVMQFGGWQEMLHALKSSADLEKARYKFYFAYEDVLEGQ